MVEIRKCEVFSNMELEQYRNKIANLSVEEQVLRNLYLRKIALGKIQGPNTGYASIDKPWLGYFSDESIETSMPKTKIYDYLYENNKEHLNEVALTFQNVQCTFKELFEKIDEIAKAFIAIGVQKGDIVSICMPTLPETIYAFYALNKIGATPDMIDPRASVEQLKFYLNETKSKYMLVYDECLIKVHKIHSETNLQKVILSSASESLTGITKFVYDCFIKKEYIKEKDVKKDTVKYYHMKEFIREGEVIESVENVRYSDNELALLVHSSGTTSTPKGIMLSNDNVNALAFQYKISPLELQRQDRFLSVIPAFAAFGMVASVHLPLSLGMNTILVPKPSADTFDKLFIKYKPHHCLTVPKNYEALAKSKKIKDLSYFKSPGCGGDAPDAEVRVNEFLKQKGCKSPLLKGWGLSELSSTACLETLDSSKLVSNGAPLVKNTITVIDPKTNEELPLMQEGELVVSGPTMMLGYFNNQTLTDKAIHEDAYGRKWFFSGDIGFVDENGCINITDRKDRMIIKYDGKKIYPRTIENAILENDKVDACCVVTAKSNIGKVPMAYIVLKDEFKGQPQFCLQSIKQTCSEQLEERIVPDAYQIIDSLPLTAMGKVDYKKLEKDSENILIKKM